MVEFSKHALEKIEERTSLTPEEIVKIIEERRYIAVGREKNKVHKAIYSIPDGQMFIVVYADDKDVVVTVMPPDYHHHFQIDPDVFYQVRALMLAD